MKPSIQSLFTRPQANEGIKLELKLPDGKPAGTTLTVLGTDSDVFRRERVARSRENARILTLPEGARDVAHRDADVRLLATLVTAWDFEEECTPDNVARLLTEAPYIREQIDEAAANRALFLSPKS